MKHLLRFLLVTSVVIGAGSALAADQPTVSQTVFEPSALDHKPVIVSRVQPEYPAKLKAKGITGEVVINFVIDREGKVKDAVVVGATRLEFADPAFAALQKWKFRPGSKGGHAVNTWVEVTIPFRLKDEKERQ